MSGLESKTVSLNWARMLKASYVIISTGTQAALGTASCFLNGPDQSNQMIHHSSLSGDIYLGTLSKTPNLENTGQFTLRLWQQLRTQLKIEKKNTENPSYRIWGKC